MNETIKKVAFTDVKEHLLSLFSSTKPDPYGTPIKEEIKVKKVLYGSQMLLMNIESTNFLKGLELVSRKHGNEGFYAGDVANSPQQFYFVPFSQKDSYWSVIEIIEHVVISQNGDWGYVQSDEHHGLLAMKNHKDYLSLNDFIIEVDGEHAARAMVDHWLEMKASYKNYKVDCSWIRPLFIHVLGEQGAIRLLENYPL